MKIEYLDLKNDFHIVRTVEDKKIVDMWKQILKELR